MTEQHRRFGRNPSPLDGRDWKLDNFIPPILELPKSAVWEFPLDPLDQTDTAHCVGFSMAHFGINLPTLTPYTDEDAHRFYYDCKVIDGDPKGENGTTIRSAAKVLQNIGAIRNYAFASDVSSIGAWVLTKGPIIMGTIWTEGMMVPDEDGVLSTDGFILGGHAYLVNEWNAKDGYISIMNSWGKDWGVGGKAYITIEDFGFLFRYGGEALAAVELENYRTTKDECFLTRLFTKIFGTRSKK